MACSGCRVVFMNLVTPKIPKELQGDVRQAKMFLGKDSQLARDPEWTIETKNFDQN